MAWSDAARAAAAETRRRNSKGKVKKPSAATIRSMKRTNEMLDYQRAQTRSMGSNPMTKQQALNMKNEVLAFRKKHGIVRKGSKLKVGVSGNHKY